MSEVRLYEGPAPVTPPAGVVTVYSKIDGKLYWMTSAGVETPFYPEGSGTGDLLSDGSIPLSANWDMGAFQITIETAVFSATSGQPFFVTATDTVVGLSADRLDGQHGSYFLDGANFYGDIDATHLGGELPIFYTNAAIASRATAEAGTDDIETMTSLKVAQAIAAQTRGYVGSVFQNGLTYTLVLENAGYIVEMDNVADNTVYIPDNSVVAFPVNTRIDVTQRGIGKTSVAMSGTDTLIGNATVAGTNGGVSLWKRQATEWVVFGGAS